MENVEMLRKASYYFLVIFQLAGIACATYGAYLLFESHLSGLLPLGLSAVVLVTGYLVRAAAMCLADITERRR